LNFKHVFRFHIVSRICRYGWCES